MLQMLDLKKHFQDSPLKRKLMVIVIVTTLLVMGVTLVIFYVDDVHSFRSREVEDRQSLAKIIARNTTAAIDFDDRAAAAETLGALAEDHEVLSAWIVLNDGEVFASYVRRPGGVGLSTVQAGGRQLLAPDALADDTGWLSRSFANIKIVFPVTTGGDKAFTVVIIADAQELKDRMVEYLLFSLVVLCVALTLGYVITLRLQRIITDPLLLLVNTMEEVRASRDYSLRASYGGRDEIGTLTVGFNEMLREVETHDEQLHRYQDKLSELIAIRTEELVRVKEEAQAAAVEKIAAVNRGAAGSPLESSAAGSDAGDALRRERRRLYALMDCIDDEVWFIDSSTGVIMANGPAGETLGIPLDDCRDRDALADGQEIYRFDLQRLQAAGSLPFLDLLGASVRRMEVMLLKNDTVPCYQVINAGLVKNGDGTVLGTVFVVRDISLQKEGEDSLRFSTRRLMEREEMLRKELSAELHDEVGRDLAALHLNNEIINNSMPDELREKLRDRIEVVHGLLEELSHKVANIISELRPPMLDDFGLKTALQWLAGIVLQRHGITVELLVDDDIPRLGTDKETVLFRIAQEAVNNAAKYSGAKTITVSLDAVGEDIILHVVDDGIGFDPEAHHGTERRKSWGLTIMRERAESVGGSFSLVSAPGSGTTIIVEMGGVDVC